MNGNNAKKKTSVNDEQKVRKTDEPTIKNLTEYYRRVINKTMMEPLEEEVRNTQWLGGLIVLAASDSELRKGETFQEFRARTASAVTGDQPLYAFHVSFFDLQKMEFTERSRLVRL